jgi:uncharacterized protein (TIGR03435 family)
VPTKTYPTANAWRAAIKGRIRASIVVLVGAAALEAHEQRSGERALRADPGRMAFEVGSIKQNGPGGQRRATVPGLRPRGRLAATEQSPLPSQSSGTEARPSFDVASVMPNKSGGRRGGALQPGRFAQTGVTLRQLIRMAYGTGQIVGAPSWVDSDRFDIEGKAEFDLGGFLPGPNGSPPRVYLMLQGLLEERFKLAVHKQMQERSVYALVVARRDRRFGPRLQRSAIDCDAQIAAVLQSGRLPAPPQPAAPHCSMSSLPGRLTADSVEMSQLAGALSSLSDRFVLDRTGLAGPLQRRACVDGRSPGLPKPAGCEFTRGRPASVAVHGCSGTARFETGTDNCHD